MFQHVIQLIDGAGLNAVQRGDTHDDIDAHVFRQRGQHIRRPIRFEIGQHDGDDLRMFQTNDVRHGTRLHPLQGIQTLGIASHEDAVQQGAGLVLTQGIDQHLTQVLLTAHAQ